MTRCSCTVSCEARSNGELVAPSATMVWRTAELLWTKTTTIPSMFRALPLRTAGTDGDEQVYRSLGGAATSSDVNEDDGWGSGDSMEEYTDSDDEFVKAVKVKTKAEWGQSYP